VSKGFTKLKPEGLGCFAEATRKSCVKVNYAEERSNDEIARRAFRLRNFMIV
jgi:hypothetical protein